MSAYTVDCDAGRRLGCSSYCCRLLVRLEPDERDPTQPDNAEKRCVDKDPASGRCIHQDPESGRCAIYHQRPRICRAYDCNRDPMLTVVLREGFRSVVETARKACREPVPPKPLIPYKAVDPGI